MNTIVYAATPISSDSWLNEEKYSSFKKAYEYAMLQTKAIPTLSETTPEGLYNTMYIILRKMRILNFDGTSNYIADEVESDLSLHAAMSGNLNDTY